MWDDFLSHGPTPLTVWVDKNPDGTYTTAHWRAAFYFARNLSRIRFWWAKGGADAGQCNFEHAKFASVADRWILNAALSLPW